MSACIPWEGVFSFDRKVRSAPLPLLRISAERDGGVCNGRIHIHVIFKVRHFGDDVILKAEVSACGGIEKLWMCRATTSVRKVGMRKMWARRRVALQDVLMG